MDQLKKIDFNDYEAYLKPRDKNWHKGLSGHVLIIGGDVGFSGAPRMAAEAALRVGAGLVTVATHPENSALINVDHPEIMSHPVEDSASLAPLLAKATVIVMGPGLGQSAWSKAVWQVAMLSTLPLIVDADALNLLAKTPSKKDNWVLTPHPGEAARLLGCDTKTIQADRAVAVIKLQTQFGGTVVLKGAGTLVRSNKPDTLICDKGNPGMASAGMGDVLSGVIGGLLAQQLPIEVAAALGVYIHAAAGDMAARAGERGTLATDLLPFLRALVNVTHDD